MQALDLFEASLCPGCQRPLDVCQADTESMPSLSVDTHVCGFQAVAAVQKRLDEWEHDESGKRGAMPSTPKWSDGLVYLRPRPSTPEELA